MIKTVSPFEEKGMEIQNRAYDKAWAIRQFENSCNICCLRGLQIDCKSCGIQTTHELILASLEVLEETNKTSK
jgi:hypothetical protein